MDTLLALDTSVLRMTEKKETIPFPNDGRGLGASKTIWEGEVVGYYYGSLDYAILIRKRQTTRKYEKGMMKVNVEMFRRWVNNPIEKVIDEDGNMNTMWIVPAPFYTMRYINDARHMPGGTTMESKRLKKPRENKVQFLQGRLPISRKYFGTNRILSVEALRSTALGEKLLMHYKIEFEFHRQSRYF